MKLFIFLFIFVTTPVYANFTEACFDSKVIAAKALKDIEFLLLASDKVQRSENCFKVSAPIERIHLFQKYLKKKYKVHFMDLTASPRENCQLEMIKMTKNNSDKIKIETHAQNIQDLSQKKQISETTNIMLTEGLPGSITFQEHTYEIICDKSLAGYNIKLKSLSPDFILNTSRFIKHGESIELGSVIKRGDKATTSIDLNTGLKTHSKRQTQQVQVYLRAKQ